MDTHPYPARHMHREPNRHTTLSDAAGHLPEVVMPYRFIRRPKYVLMEFYRGAAGQGTARHGLDGHGRARRGKARQGKDEYDSADDLRKSIKACFEAVKQRVAQGGPGWNEYPREKEHEPERRSGDSKPQGPRGGSTPRP